MKRSMIRLFEVLAIAGALLFTAPGMALSQDEQAADTANINGPAEESSAFQDSVRFDDMDPIFYEAEEDEPVTKQKSKGLSTATIAIVLVVVLGIIIVLVKRFASKKK